MTHDRGTSTALTFINMVKATSRLTRKVVTFKGKIFPPLYDSKHPYPVITSYVALLNASLMTQNMPSHKLC